MNAAARRSLAGIAMSFVVLRAGPRFAAGFAVAVALPVVLRYGLDLQTPMTGSAWNTIAGIAAAFCAGSFVLSKMTRFAGVRSTSYVVPCFTTCYGATLLVFFFLRFDYTRSVFLASYLLCVLWFFVVTVLRRARWRPSFAVVPFGKVTRLDPIGTADFVTLTAPKVPDRAVDAMIADFDADLPQEWQKFIADWVLGGRPAYHVKQAIETITGRVDIEHLSENSFGSLDPGRAYRKLKQIIDVAIALALLPAFALLALGLGLAIRLDSPGPVFFRQERIGYRGRPFNVVKFRTMANASEPSWNERQDAMTVNGDPRITRLGRRLRRSRLDEVPQILNVLRGEMSWIGPRPEARPLAAWYEEELPFYRYRHVVRPGITGWAQVNQGHVVEMQDVLGKLHYDFYYIKYFSPSLDALIALRTLWIMSSGQGAR